MIKIYPFNNELAEVFEKEKRSIMELFKNCNICHIGSTAVPGLGGKGIVDILITIDNWNKEDELIEKLKSLGFSHIHKKENGRRFLSREPENTKFKGTHVHIVEEESKEHKEIIAFRDYLISNPSDTKKYFDLKVKLKEEDPKEYNKAKGKYIKKILKEIQRTKEVLKK